MARRATNILATLALVAGSGPANAATVSLTLQAIVPVACQVRHSSAGVGGSADGTVPLGQLNEFCNAAQGYELIVSYAPGTMRGAVLVVGEDRVVLNGSGEAVVSRSLGARIRNRMLSATPGDAGFDTDRLNFRVQVV